MGSPRRHIFILALAALLVLPTVARADEGGPAGLVSSFELLVLAAPDQPRDFPCNARVDCLSPARTFFGGAIRGELGIPESWRIGATLDITHLVDQDERPEGGYTVTSLEIDILLELGRKRDHFGAALRVSPVVAFAWADSGSGWQSSLPGVALLLGRTDLWGEVGIPGLPTPADPRLFHLACGFEFSRVKGLAGFATIGTLGFSKDTVDKAGSFPGAFAYLSTPLTPAFDLTLQTILSRPFVLGLGFRTAL